MSASTAEVAIVGAGPVGLTLAMRPGAARRRSVVVLETRARGEPPNVKCNHVSARTMEQLPPPRPRRATCATPACRADYPNDVVFRTTVDRHRALAHPHPVPRATATRDTSGPDGVVADAGAAAPHQPDLSRADPVRARRGACRRDDPATAREVDGFAQDERRRRSHGARPRQRRDAARCAPATWSAATAAARWSARRSARAFAGTPVIQRVQSTLHPRAASCSARMPGKRAWSCYAAQPAAQRHRASRSTAARPGWCTTT